MGTLVYYVKGIYARQLTMTTREDKYREGGTKNSNKSVVASPRVAQVTQSCKIRQVGNP